MTFCRYGDDSAMVENSTSPITAMKTQPPMKLRSLKIANWMNGRGVVNECAKK